MIFFSFHIEIEGKGGWIIGGAKGYVGPPSQIIGGGGPAPPPPAPPPSSYAYVLSQRIKKRIRASYTALIISLIRNSERRMDLPIQATLTDILCEAL